jgi:hypothetical protein
MHSHGTSTDIMSTAGVDTIAFASASGFKVHFLTGEEGQAGRAPGTIQCTVMKAQGGCQISIGVDSEEEGVGNVQLKYTDSIHIVHPNR